MNINSFNRLFTFGCSHTVGEHLPGWLSAPENLKKNGNYKVIFSDLNWPNILAKKIGINYVYNLAVGGNSNHEILQSIRRINFTINDLCIICWSYSGREILYDTETTISRTMELVDKERKLNFYFAHNEYDLEMRSREYVDHAALYLSNQGVTYRMGQIERWRECSEYWPINCDSQLLFFDVIDTGADNAHPGINSHQTFADKLYNTF